MARSPEQAEAISRAADAAMTPVERMELVWELTLRMPWDTMQQNSDLIEPLAALNAAGAEYLLVDAYARAFHGYPRATKDADIFIGTNLDNARKVWEALLAFEAPLSELSIEDLSTSNTFFRDGVTFEELG